MVTFNKHLNESIGPQQDLEKRQRIMAEIEQITGRKLLVYAVDFQKGNTPIPNYIEMNDKVGFSDLLEGLDGQPVDIIIHSPGGYAEAAEEIVNMIRETHDDVRFIVPGSAMSAATLMVLSGDCVLMDERSSLGPIDPQVPMPLPTGGFRSVPAQTILDGFNKAKEVITNDGPKAIPTYMPLLNKYDLHLLEICENSKLLSSRLAREWLEKYMLKGLPPEERTTRSAYIADFLSNHNNFLSHSRAINIHKAIEIGLNVLDMRTNTKLRSKIWSLYCLILIFLEKAGAVKMFENSLGVNWSRKITIQQGPQLVIQQPPAPIQHKQKKK